MAENEISDYFETDASNVDIAGITVQENAMKPANVNNAFRALQGALKRWFKTSLFRLRDSTDQTKLLALDLSGLTTATTRTLKVPNSNGTILTTGAMTLSTEEKAQVQTNIGSGSFSPADKTKLDGIAAGAQVNPTAAAIKTAYESNANSNALTDALLSKLNGVATGANVGQPVPASSALPVNTSMICILTSATSVADGATVAGSGLNMFRLSSAGAVAGNTALSGTWRNISGGSVAQSVVALFVRTA